MGNLLKFLLKRFQKPTLGVLLGLLLGSVVGLWPFQEGVKPEAGNIVKGSIVTQESIAEIDKDDWPITLFTPSPIQIASSVGLMGLGLAITIGFAAIGNPKDNDTDLSLDS